MDTQQEIPLTEKKSKVKHLSFKKEWKGTYGAMFDFNIEFENGDKGIYQTNLKDEKLPSFPFKVDEEADYSIESKIKGRFNDVWIKFLPKHRGGGTRRQFEKNYKAEFIIHAASYAKDLIVANKTGTKKFGEIFQPIYEVMEAKLNEVNKSNATQENNPEQK